MGSDNYYCRKKKRERLSDGSGLMMWTPRRSSYLSLHKAARSGNLSRVHELLARGAGVKSGKQASANHSGHANAPSTPRALIDERGMWGNTPLLIAAQYSHTIVALALIEYGADVCVQNERNATPLLYACAEGAVNLGRALVTRGALVDAPIATVHHPDVDGGRTLSLTPICAAAIGGHPELVRLLVENGAQVDRRVPMYGLERRQCCTFFMEKGATMSALIGAARNGHHEICQFFMELDLHEVILQ